MHEDVVRCGCALPRALAIDARLGRWSKRGVGMVVERKPEVVERKPEGK